MRAFDDGEDVDSVLQVVEELGIQFFPVNHFTGKHLVVVLLVEASLDCPKLAFPYLFRLQHVVPYGLQFLMHSYFFVIY